jgi:transposase InsO family protein
MSADESAPIEIVKALTFRAAKARFRISYDRWRAIKDGKLEDWHPYRGGGVSPEHVEEVLDSVRSFPAWNSHVRAKKLGRRTETVHQILKAKGLSRLLARLKYAGFTCDVTSSLARARQHRVLAGGPGIYTNVDFKRLGAVRRLERGDRSPSSRFVCGLQCVDAYSGFASCFLCEHEDATSAVAGFKHYTETAPFKVSGLVLSDNGLPFLSEEFVGYLKLFGFVQRTTQYNHPWSNGKVEAFNRTLKYEAMPGLVAAGLKGPEETQGWMDIWCHHYNFKRIHHGWINRGLPPSVVAELWEKTAGDVFDKLVSLGHIRPNEVHRTRLMGSGKHAVDISLERDHPFAFIIEAPPPRMPKALKDGWTLQR